MKLKDYFQNHSDNFLTDNEKFLLYQKIIERKESNFYNFSFFQNVFLKRMVYSAFSVIIVFFVYALSYYANDIRYMTNYLVVQNAGDSVQAAHLAQIVYFDGSFVIENNGKRIQTSLIRAGDMVTLNSSTKMIFHIDEQTKAELIGPARFVLNQVDGDYYLNLIYGDFVEIQSLSDVVDHNLNLLMDDLIINQNKGERSYHFQIVKESGVRQIQNRGSSVSVFDVNDNTRLITVLGQEYVMEIGKDNANIIDNLGNVASVFLKGEISQTSLLSYENDEKRDRVEVVEDEEFVSVLIESLDKDIQEFNNAVEDILESELLSDVNANSKKVISPEMDKVFSSNLYSQFLMSNVRSTVESYVGGDEDVLKRNLSNMKSNIDALYRTIDLKQESYSISNHDLYIIGMSKNLNTLHDYLINNYYIPARYLDNINVFANWLDKIVSYEFDSVENVEGWLDSEFSSLSNNLIFK